MSQHHTESGAGVNCKASKSLDNKYTSMNYRNCAVSNVQKLGGIEILSYTEHRREG